MSGIFWALLGQLFLGLSLVIDKILLDQKPKKDQVLSYIFWIGLLNFVGLLFAPFGFAVPSTTTILLSLLAGALFLVSLATYYAALAKGGVSSTLAIIGGFAPIATYLISGFFSFSSLNVAEGIAFALLVAGGLLLFFTEKIDFKKIFLWVILASLFIGLADVSQKLAFNTANFVTVFVSMKFFTGVIALCLLAIPSLRRRIFSSSADTSHKYRISYFLNRALSGASSFLIFYGIALEAQPALVESLSGVRFVLIFLIAFAISKIKPAWLNEKFRGWILAGKIIATILILLGLLGLGLQKSYESKPIPDPEEITWGVTFSKQMSKSFGSSWQENLTAILTDLKPKTVRLIAYWDEIEPKKDQYDFEDLDWQMNEARKAGVPVVLVVGQKVPRWPECHFPSWIDPGSAQKNDELITYLKEVVERYRGDKNILYWQVENEPFLMFGECPGSNAALIEKEIATVRELDPTRKIYMTDGGEFGDWYRTAKRADIFGPTLYRKVHTKLFGYITWPITPELYPLRRDITRALVGKPNQEFVISELGLEPWMVRQIYEVDIPTQLSFFSLDDFKNNIAYARQTGFSTFYTWGAEWWYWLKKQDHPEFWNAAKELFAGKQLL
ncbi:MAG: Uncharacterized protein LiPW15_80 [Parcubacteria group bacterium LiPW_15]|nr:MAG: Uncharacterized protein LiPW15_80 [Parcubacteria group bacterium LiPW_15]